MRVSLIQIADEPREDRFVLEKSAMPYAFFFFGAITWPFRAMHRATCMKPQNTFLFDKNALYIWVAFDQYDESTAFVQFTQRLSL